MEDYWISFRIADRGRYDERYTALNTIVRGYGELYWDETSSFILLRSSASLNDLADALKAEVNPDWDMVLIRKLNSKAGVLIGRATDPDLFEFMPYLKKR